MEETKKIITRKEILKQFKKKTQFQEILTRFLRNRLAIVGIVMFAIILLIAIFAPLLADYQTEALGMNPSERLQGPSMAHWFGTDEMGRDVFARVVHGARTSLSIGFIATLFSLLIGGALGAIAGYVGGWLDEVIMRVMDVMLCLPEMLLAIAIVAAFGTSTTNMVIAIGISRVPRFARIVRSSVLTVRGMEYVEAARAIGANSFTIVTRHVLMNCLAPIIVQISLIFASAILAISSLSFLGLGIQPPAPEWGNMLATGRQYMRGNSHLVLAPGLAIFFSIFSLNLLGDGLRDALDPRLKQ
ncbi:MAG: ABC transporter permease [Pygmaiobacter massiliensis]|nr:ABC transporter permease [Pygmaiobacter massiliensis]